MVNISKAILLTSLGFSALSYGNNLPTANHPDRARRPAEPFKVDLNGVNVPQDLEVCFSPVDPCAAKLIKFVTSATSTLDVAIYDINIEPLVQLLIEKNKQVKLRVVVDLRQSKEINSGVDRLLKAGVNVRYGHQKGIMHNKFVIVDGVKLETGSFNYTHHATLANNENQLYIYDQNVVDRYVKRYEDIWNASLSFKDRN